MTPSKTSDPIDNYGLGYDVKYPYEVALQEKPYQSEPGVPLPLIEWCGQHCKGKWGWYFKEINSITYPDGQISPTRSIAIMTFEFDKDAFWFALTHGESE